MEKKMEHEMDIHTKFRDTQDYWEYVQGLCRVWA